MKQDGGLKCHMSPPSGRRRRRQPVVTRGSGLSRNVAVSFLQMSSSYLITALYITMLLDVVVH